jgi:hypothetical protein
MLYFMFFRFFMFLKLIPCLKLIAELLGAACLVEITARLLKRIEATLLPFASTSWLLVLATLAFFAVFKVLIRDFFWMDMGGSAP